MLYRTSQSSIGFHIQIILVSRRLQERIVKILLNPYKFHRIIIFFIHTSPPEVKSLLNIRFIINLT